LSGKRLVGRVLVTRRFAAGWAAQSDSYLGNRSWVSSALGAQVELPHVMGSTESDERSGLSMVRWWWLWLTFREVICPACPVAS
jgi:hypothetical protein